MFWIAGLLRSVSFQSISFAIVGGVGIFIFAIWSQWEPAVARQNRVTQQYESEARAKFAEQVAEIEAQNASLSVHVTNARMRESELRAQAQIADERARQALAKLRVSAGKKESLCVFDQRLLKEADR